MAFDVTGLNGFKDELAMGLVRASILEGRTADLITVQPGIKTTDTINIIGGAVALQDGAACGFLASGDTAITQRDLSVAAIKVNEEYCINELEKYFTQKMMSAGSYNEEIPFEQIFAEEKVGQIQKLVEELIWQGDTAGAPGANYFDGFLKILGAEASVIDVTVDLSASGIVDSIDAMIAAIPADAIMSEDLAVFAGYEVVRTYQKALRDANLYHYPVAGEDNFRFTIPGTNVEMIGVAGLNGTDELVLAERSNLYMGTDLLSDYENFDLWYSKDNDVVRMKARFKVGVNVAFPERIV